MPTNLLLLPLLAGYIFVHIYNRFRFRAQSLDGYRLLIESTMAGLTLLGLSRLCIVIAGTFLPSLPRAWALVVPEKEFAYLGTAIGSILLGLVLPTLDNFRYRVNAAEKISKWLLLGRHARPLRRLTIQLRHTYRTNRSAALDAEIRRHGGGLLRFLHEAASNGNLISVTMVNRKWYVGYVAEAVNLEPRETCFKILPIMSGFRDKDTLAVMRQVYYRPVYEMISGRRESIARFVLTLFLKDVQDAREFDEEIYEDQFSARSDAEA